LLVRARIGAHWAAQCGPECFAPMASVTSGIGNDPYLDRREGSVFFCAELYMGCHLVARGSSDELFFAGELPFDRATDLEDREHAKIFSDHLLLAAKTTTDSLRKDMQMTCRQRKNMDEF